ncbi:type II toxin-antitoxin system VapC family toxin [Salinibacterium sp.]|uniref:type II toxin-antitoxin system VapC family toxin n=1 Tax=Salinibacterium sp. TaxID=1915057 RepID=UPI00286A56B4|nr:type II toxin-antitoxin system VapC family toxin [Salinibacterium sp.]
MRYLLDTHTFLWLVSEPGRIPGSTLDLLGGRSHELLVSAVGAFELSTKYRLGKLPEAQRALLTYGDLVARLGAVELPISRHPGLVAGELAWDHRDPFDRLLAAQGLTESLTLVSADPAFATLGGLQTVWGSQEPVGR